MPKLGLPTACLACAEAKLKCDKSLPVCGRCARNGLVCVPGPPSSQGRRRKRSAHSPKALLPPSYDLAVEAMLESLSSLSLTKSAGHAGILSFLQEMVTCAILWRDNRTMGAALLHAEKYNITMEMIFCEELDWLASLMYRPLPDTFNMIGPRIKDCDIPPAISAALDLGLGETNWVYGSRCEKGVTSLFITRDFEEAFGYTIDSLEKRIGLGVKGLRDGSSSNLRSYESIEACDFEVLIFPDSESYARHNSCYSRAVTNQTSLGEPGLATTTQPLTARTFAKAAIKVHGTYVFCGFGPNLMWSIMRLCPHHAPSTEPEMAAEIAGLLFD